MRSKELVEYRFQILVQGSLFRRKQHLAFGVEAEIVLFLVRGVHGRYKRIHIDQIDNLLQIRQSLVRERSGPPPGIPDDDETAVFLCGYIEIFPLIFETDVFFFVQLRLAPDGLEHSHHEVLCAHVIQIFLCQPIHQHFMLSSKIEKAHNRPHRQSNHCDENSQVFHNCSVF